MLLQANRSPIRGLRLSLSAYKQTCSRAASNDTHQDPNVADDDESSLPPPPAVSYPGYIETTPLQRLLLAGGSSLIGLANPWRADMVAVSGEVTGGAALEFMLNRFHETAEGQRVLVEQPRITDETLKNLSHHPADTLGGIYYTFMHRYKLSPSSRDPVQFVDDAQLAYVMTRYRETHDLTHAVLGMPTNMLGEVLVKWVEAQQTRLPMCVGGALLGPLRFKSEQRRKYPKLLPWAVSVGSKAAFLPAVYYEQRWDQNIFELRSELNIPEPPSLK